ncbi:unnamed protein product [Soboliphyme baturini]|uniref:EIF2A domain-containing protein n=1 Tax=Soboliphyme baturini TaxID=241478 RepID=A0A183IBG1_9BILA|nr:unnamed protein product [Soboliphyme baturini]
MNKCSSICVVFSTETWQAVSKFPAPNCEHISFVPGRRLLCTWRQYAVYGLQKTTPEPNLHVFNVDTGEKVSQFISTRENYWFENFDVSAYEDNNFFRVRIYKQKLVLKTMSDFSLSPGQPPYHIVCYIPASSARPASARMYACGLTEPVSNIIASRSFFQADHAKMHWNRKGSAVLVMAVVDVDAQGTSYYGKENLYLLRTNGEGCMVPLNKDGPIYSIDWHPNSQLFCVVYGFMPPKAALLNLNAEMLYDFGPGPKNLVYFNPFGNNILLQISNTLVIAAFIMIWALKDKKAICKFIAEDTTLFHWFADGQHFVTATTTPRLRVNNGYKIWHISGRTVYEYKCPVGEEIYDLQFLHTPGEEYTVPAIPEACVAASAHQASVSSTSVPGKSWVSFQKFRRSTLPRSRFDSFILQQSVSELIVHNKRS